MESLKWEMENYFIQLITFGAASRSLLLSGLMISSIFFPRIHEFQKKSDLPS